MTTTRQEQRIEHWRASKLMRGVRKEITHNREENRVRKRDWLPDDPADPDAWDEVEATTVERVMPRGERERRRNNLTRARDRQFEELETDIDASDDVDEPAASGWHAALAGWLAQDENRAADLPPRPAPPQTAGRANGQDGMHRGSNGAGKNGAASPASSGVQATPPVNGQGTRAAPGQGSHPADGAARTGGLPSISKPGLGRTAQPASAVPARRRSILAEPPGPGQGTVLEVSTGLSRVDTGNEILLCALRGALTAAETGMTNVVAVGDRVQVEPDGAGRGVITAVLPRRSALSRPDVFYGHLRQVIAANVDQLLAVASWREPAFWPELVDRYLITAQLNNLRPLICINKIDLADDMDAGRRFVQPYVALGYPVIFTSAVSGQGIDELRAALSGQTTVLAGLSGVGKSSLLAAVQPGLHLRTAEISERQHLGRHTTTQATLHALNGGGYVVDTPGIREFGLAGLRRAELGRYYPEIAAAAPECRFGDCTHLEEPGCAVQARVRAGRMARMRYDSYRKIYYTLPP